MKSDTLTSFQRPRPIASIHQVARRNRQVRAAVAAAGAGHPLHQPGQRVIPAQLFGQREGVEGARVAAARRRAMQVDPVLADVVGQLADGEGR